MILDSHAYMDMALSLGWHDNAEKLVGMMDSAGMSKATINGYLNARGPNSDNLNTIAKAVEKCPE